MPKPDKDKIIPWLAVVFAGFVLGALGRYIALQQSGDAGTANLTFVIVLGGIVFMYLLFLILWDSIHQIINRKNRTVQELPANQSAKDDEKPEQTSDYSFAYPDMYRSEDIDEFDESNEGDSVEEEMSPTIAMPPTRPDWVEVREREFQERFAPFREYVHFSMEPYVSAEELARLDGYVELFAREAPLPADIVPIRPERLKNPDLYHFGWNMQNYFKVGKREDVVPWLQKVFIPLRDLEFSTIKGKLHDLQTKRFTIPNIDDIPKYMAEKRS